MTSISGKASFRIKSFLPIPRVFSTATVCLASPNVPRIPAASAAALAGVPVLASVFIPQIAGHPEDRRAHLPKLFLATVLVIVVLIVSIFYSARNYLPLLIFGADFRELSLLLVPMGLSVAIRYVGSLPGTALIAMKEQRKRIKSLSLTVLLGAIAVTVLVLDLTSFTITSWSLSLIYLMMGVVQTVLFYISYAKIANRTKSNEQAR